MRTIMTIGLELAPRADNVVVTRTFSKIHGLAAPAAGLGLCPQRRSAMCLIAFAGPSTLRHLQQRAGAAAIADKAHVATSRGLSTPNGAMADATRSASWAFESMTAPPIFC